MAQQAQPTTQSKPAVKGKENIVETSAQTSVPSNGSAKKTEDDVSEPQSGKQYSAAEKRSLLDAAFAKRTALEAAHAAVEKAEDELSKSVLALHDATGPEFETAKEGRISLSKRMVRQGDGQPMKAKWTVESKKVVKDDF